MYMITLDNFEDFVPYKIWMRGEEYYETDAVSELEEISPGEWTATVEGTDDYNVEISMDGNEIESWYCDCPYDGEICKHVVAALLAIRDNRSKTGCFLSAKEVDARMNILGQSVSEIVKDKEVEQVLRFVESDKLSGFVLQYASRNKESSSSTFGFDGGFFA